MNLQHITTPLTKEAIKGLSAGDEVCLSGVVFTARDAAHKRLSELMKKGAHMPINLRDSVIYYAGPTPPPPRRVIGSCGPTTSSRMDPFTEDMLKLGVTGMIGKGDRSDSVRKSITEYGCIYFLATGGTGALLATKIKSAKPILFRDLGPEAIYKLEVKDFPLIVGIDSKGKNVYDAAGWKRM